MLAVNCVWSNFTEWSLCSVPCGNGTQTRGRSVITLAQNGGTNCTGDATETTPCNPDPCRKLFVH